MILGGVPGGVPMQVLSLSNPVFTAYVIAAAAMLLKGIAMSWLTVIRMMQAHGGFRSPEDLRRTPLNPDPSPSQLAPNDRVERIRRIQQNDLENLPYFFIAGLIYVFSQPDPTLARWLYYGYAATRFAHFFAYLTAQTHDLRAALWTPGSLILVYMTIRGLAAALGA
jgi:glutathione S-transferase